MKRFFLWLASFRLRIVFRSAFLFLILAVLTLALTVLLEEKRRSYHNYHIGFLKTQEQIAARLRHPSGQLALLNPPAGPGAEKRLHPVLLPYTAIDYDDQNKARHAIEMAGCLIQYKHGGSLCVAIGNNPWVGGFIYAAGTFTSSELVTHPIGNPALEGAHRLQASVELRGQTYRWIAPFEVLPSKRGLAVEGLRGRLTGYVERDDRDYNGQMPVKEFRGWIWQYPNCLDPTLDAEQSPGCERKSFFSLRLPVEILIADLLRTKNIVWPPPDLTDIHVEVKMLPPGDGPPLFDSNETGAIEPFSLNDLGAFLQPGEVLRIRKAGDDRDLLRLEGQSNPAELASPLLARLVGRLPVGNYDEIFDATDEIATPSGNYTVYLHGDADSVNRALTETATRVSWFVVAMLLAIILAWLVIEAGMIRRIARLTRHSRRLTKSVSGTDTPPPDDLSSLKGSDELGILANCLNDLLRRVREDAQREKIRAEQEKDLWHAVGHEIMSPLQSLLALHGDPDDPSFRYINRMQQAVRVLYGSASPSEAFKSSSLDVATLDLDKFLENIAANATHIGIEEVHYETQTAPMLVHGDEYSLEDVISHLLRNADRYRRPGTPILLRMEAHETLVLVVVYNDGPQIAAELIGKIFEYGVSGPQEGVSSDNRGQGLFVAKTYMAKMGGTIAVRNEIDGVSFILGLQRAGNG